MADYDFNGTDFSDSEREYRGAPLTRQDLLTISRDLAREFVRAQLAGNEEDAKFFLARMDLAADRADLCE